MHVAVMRDNEKLLILAPEVLKNLDDRVDKLLLLCLQGVLRGAVRHFTLCSLALLTRRSCDCSCVVMLSCCKRLPCCSCTLLEYGQLCLYLTLLLLSIF